MDETEIRKLLDAGEHREAFERIVDAFQEKAFHLALSLTRNHATARDLAQDSLLRVWKALPSYNGTASLSTWIPQSMKKNGAPVVMTLASQKMAKPHHSRLNGITKASDERSRIPRRGCPLQSRRSPELN